ncbi:MAG TPA: cell envelope integrity protein CreD [Thermoanaerobaculia bacterium]|nr:cell envelope integrity protein CreD [Thermoanaerobaculia bacterium]
MFDRFRDRRSLKGSPTFKLMVMGGLVLLLLIPLSMVGSLIYERENRRNQAVHEVASLWGEAQTLAGPLLTVPFREALRESLADGKEKITVITREAQFFPETLHVEGQVRPEKRHRGIFEAVLYRADLEVTGTFRRPSFAEWRVAPENVQWNDARLSFGLPDLRGVRQAGDLVWQGRSLPLAPGGAEPGLWSSGLRVAVPGLDREAGEVATFRIHLVVDGSSSLHFLPVGKQTTVALRSPWPAPSFTGKFLPEAHTVRADGFTASWSIPYFGRSYPQQWRADEVERVVPRGTLDLSSFGVDLFLPVDAYQKTERAQKYAILFLLLTFLTFFVYEMWSPVAIHSVQYLLVGAALCLFYLLLLSLSEHLAFGIAYGIAAVAIVGLITGYAYAILEAKGRSLLLGAILTTLYGYLYVLLQVEDYALLLGSLGLFLILAVMMFLTRRVNRAGSGMGGGERVEAVA